jgi:hypothetical protein
MIAAASSPGSALHPPSPLHLRWRWLGGLCVVVGDCRYRLSVLAAAWLVTAGARGAGAQAITHTLLAAGNNPVNQKVYTTTFITPAPGTLVTAAILGHKSTTPPASAVLSSPGLVWIEAVTIEFDPVNAPRKRLAIYRAVSRAPGAGSLTITFNANVSNCQWIVSQWAGVDTSAGGANAIRQAATARADAAGSLTIALDAFGDPRNVGYGVFGAGSSTLAVVPGAGFVEISEQPSAESPLSTLSAELATNRNTITASWGTVATQGTLTAGALGIEIKAATAAAPPPAPPLPTVVLRPYARLALTNSVAEIRTEDTVGKSKHLLAGVYSRDGKYKSGFDVRPFMTGFYAGHIRRLATDLEAGLTDTVDLTRKTSLFTVQVLCFGRACILTITNPGQSGTLVTSPPIGAGSIRRFADALEAAGKRDTLFAPIRDSIP